MKKIAVIGAGSWGTALAITLSTKGHSVKICDINREHVQSMKEHGENIKYLPGIKFNDNLNVVYSNEEAVENADIVIFSAPAQFFREAFESSKKYITEEMVVVNVAKGIEQGTLLRMSEIAYSIMPGVKYVVLSGPSHAEEVGHLMPTTVAVASEDIELANYIQQEFSTDRLRIYTNDDVCGVELGGALKNIIALGAGISDGIGFGDNAKAALMTRGITEMQRLGEKLGAKASTFAGLTGVGDLIVTCTSMHSRNRRCGIMIGEGIKPGEATKKVGMVVEGMFTAVAAYELAEKVGVEMPITKCIYDCINERITAKEAVEILMKRDKKNEMQI
ncbi:MAG: NAD(P)H-dependent glycerol-3-phosphate dehydrogenase [Hornefia sp.]|nr:NAD(P)H-dependent glycerol-3-phosphate dehydrogenase [Hornefia sp.]